MIVNSTVDKNRVVEKGFYYGYLSTEGLIWKTLDQDLNTKEFLGTGSKGVFLLRNLGHGKEGWAWLACNSARSQCVLKTFRLQEDSGIL